MEGAKTLVKGEGGGEEVVFWTSFTGPVDVASLTKIVKTFNEQSSDATVTMVQVPGDETDVSKLMTAVRGGVGPDVYHLDRFTTSERTRRSRSLRWTGLAHRPGPAHLRLHPLRRPGLEPRKLNKLARHQAQPPVVFDRYEGLNRPPWGNSPPRSLWLASEQRAVEDGKMPDTDSE